LGSNLKPVFSPEITSAKRVTKIAALGVAKLRVVLDLQGKNRDHRDMI